MKHVGRYIGKHIPKETRIFFVLSAVCGTEEGCFFSRPNMRARHWTEEALMAFLKVPCHSCGKQVHVDTLPYEGLPVVPQGGIVNKFEPHEDGPVIWQ